MHQVGSLFALKRLQAETAAELDTLLPPSSTAPSKAL